MIILNCNGKERKVMNISISTGPLGCSLVNDRHDDLFDLGYTAEELAEYGLEIRDETT